MQRTVLESHEIVEADIVIGGGAPSKMYIVCVV